MTVGIVAAAIVFWPAAPLFLLMHGKDITSPSGTDVPTFINGDMKLDLARFQQAESGPTQPAVGAVATNLAISSTPVGAEIYMDQNFVGNTPSTLSIPSGKHSESVRKAGFQDWSRDMSFSGGAITLNAELAAGSTTSAPVPAAGPQSAAVSQPQTVVVTQADVSLGEAVRRNKAAKAKENPPPQH